MRAMVTSVQPYPEQHGATFILDEPQFQESTSVSAGSSGTERLWPARSGPSLIAWHLHRSRRPRRLRKFHLRVLLLPTPRYRANAHQVHGVDWIVRLHHKTSWA